MPLTVPQGGPAVRCGRERSRGADWCHATSPMEETWVQLSSCPRSYGLDQYAIKLHRRAGPAFPVGRNLVWWASSQGESCCLCTANWKCVALHEDNLCSLNPQICSPKPEVCGNWLPLLVLVTPNKMMTDRLRQCQLPL